MLQNSQKPNEEKADSVRQETECTYLEHLTFIEDKTTHKIICGRCKHCGKFVSAKKWYCDHCEQSFMLGVETIQIKASEAILKMIDNMEKYGKNE